MFVTLQNIDPDKGMILLINKPLRWTSFDVINKLKYEIRNLTSQKKFKIGHAGTLDPLAEGLLIVCIGKYTKKIPEFQNLNKKYKGTIILGATTKSYDLEYEPENFCSYNTINVEYVKNVFREFIGNTLQTPPVFSAVKIKGKSAFEYARRGEAVEIKPKEISIYSLEILRFALPEIDFEICCSKGTYIRSLVRDIGEKLESGAYLKSLQRTAIGDFKLKDALDITPLLSEFKPVNPERKKKRFEL